MKRVRAKKRHTWPDEVKWKTVDCGCGGEIYKQTDRMRVTGGWLYRQFIRFGTERGQGMIATALAFVPEGMTHTAEEDP